jgi:hypothetical protein
MNTQTNIKSRRLFFNFLTLVIGIVVVLIVSGPSTQAQTTNAATTATTATDVPVDSSVTIAAKGTVNYPNGTITVSGNVIVNCRRVIDTTSTVSAPLVVLDLDFSQLRGTSGSLTTQKVFVTGDNRSTEIRPLQATDTIIVTNPYFENTKDGLTAKSWLVTATLNFDTATGKLTSGSISIGNNVVTKATVGTITTAN